MPMTLILALGAGALSAMAMYAIVFGALIALPLFYFAPLPLYLAGLGLGGKGVMVAIGGALVTVGVIGSVQAILPYAFAYAVPAAIVCRQALAVSPNPDGSPRWASGGDILASLTGVGAGALCAVGIITLMDSGSATLAETVRSFLTTAFEVMNSAMRPDVRDEIVGTLAPLFPGMAVASWVFMHVVNAATGQSILQRAGRALRPAEAFEGVTLPDWCSWLLVGSGACALALPGDFGYIGRNMVIVALVPFFVLGLAVAHTYARRLPKPTAALVVFYVLIVAFGPTAFMVAGAGILEQWIGLRNRLQSGNDQENV